MPKITQRHFFRAGVWLCAWFCIVASVPVSAEPEARPTPPRLTPELRAERAREFSPFENVAIGEEPMREYLRRRVFCLMTNTPKTEISAREDGTLDFSWNDAKASAWFANAVAIDARGYLLTAAHAVDGPPTSLAWPAASNTAKFELLPVRVVWRGDRALLGPRLDLALVHVSRRLPAIVPAAPQTSPKAVLFAYDFHWTGKGVKASASPTAVPLARTENSSLFYSGVCVPGESGGALVDPEGRLVGVLSSFVETKTIVTLRAADGTETSEPERVEKFIRATVVDADLLRRKIEGDWRQRSRAERKAWEAEQAQTLAEEPADVPRLVK